MNDYIKREDAYNTLTDYYHHRTDLQHDALRDALSRVHTADVRKNVRAKKVIGGGEHDGATCWFECSHCHGTVDINDAYCKHCGAVLEYES